MDPLLTLSFFFLIALVYAVVSFIKQGNRIIALEKKAESKYKAPSNIDLWIAEMQLNETLEKLAQSAKYSQQSKPSSSMGGKSVDCNCYKNRKEVEGIQFTGSNLPEVMAFIFSYLVKVKRDFTKIHFSKKSPTKYTLIVDDKESSTLYADLEVGGYVYLDENKFRILEEDSFNRMFKLQLSTPNFKP